MESHKPSSRLSCRTLSTLFPSWRRILPDRVQRFDDQNLFRTDIETDVTTLTPATPRPVRRRLWNVAMPAMARVKGKYFGGMRTGQWTLHRQQVWRLEPYSHSIVPGGLEVMSYTTRLMPRTSLTIRLEMARSTSYGSGAQSAVMPSSECTARTQHV